MREQPHKSSATPYFFLMLFFLLVPSLLAADDQASAVLSRTRYTGEEKTAVLRVFEHARQSGIPASLLLPRLEEGVAKRVPPVALVRSLEEELSSLQKAREILLSVDPDFNPDLRRAEWLRAAILVRIKLDERVIRAIAAAGRSRRQDFRPATELYVSLTAWGLPGDDAERVVVGLLASRIPGEDFDGISALYGKSRSLFLSPHTITERILTALPAVTTLEALDQRVLY